MIYEAVAGFAAKNRYHPKYSLTLNPAKQQPMKKNIISYLTELFSKPRRTIAGAAILFVPLIFIGTHTSHDWGDDFAQYIHQAENIIKGIPQSQTGYVFNHSNYIGPQAYPVGFPLLLAPVYAIAGNSMWAFTTFISLLYIVLGLLMVIFYRCYFTWITSLTLALIFLYNPQMILFKREIMSDIPFTALLVLNFILYHKLKPVNTRQLLSLALITGFMLTIRPAGFVWVAAIVMEQVVAFIRRRIVLKEFAVRIGIFILVPVMVYFIINSLIFKIPSGGSIGDYLQFYHSGKLLQIIPENLAHHIEVFRFLYVPQAGAFYGISLLLGSVMVAFTLLGLIKRLVQGPGVIEWFFIFYVIMLLIFPNNYSAGRLMFPLEFIFLFYAATGAKTIQPLQGIAAWKKAVAAGGIAMMLFMPGIIGIARSQSNILEGPQRATSVEAFEYISKNVPHEAVVVFAKPRALALYAGCHSMADPFTSNPTLILTQIIEGNATFMLQHSILTNETMKRYARVMENRLT